MNLKKGAEPNARKGNTSGRRVKIILVIILIPEGKMVKRNAIVRLNKNSLLNLYNMHKYRRFFLLLNAPRNPGIESCRIRNKGGKNRDQEQKSTEREH